MVDEYLGTQAVTDEDRAYSGSRFSDVCDAVFANPYQQIWDADDAPPLDRNSSSTANSNEAPLIISELRAD